MSLYRANCDRCSLEKTHSDQLRTYHLAEAIDIHVETQWAWCGACQCVVAAERIRPLSEIQHDLDSLIAREPSMMEWVGDVKKIAPDDFEARFSRMVAHFASRRDWRQSRQSPPRCLECGRIEITPFVRQRSSNPDLDSVQILEHPNCGGRIRLRCAGFSLSRGSIPYTSEGLRCDDS